MTLITHNPAPPYRAVQGTAGAWPDRLTFWEVVDANGECPFDLLGLTPDTVIDEAWCRAKVVELNGPPSSAAG